MMKKETTAESKLEKDLKKEARNATFSFILAALLCLALGVALLMWPDSALLVLCYIIGAILAIYGAVNIILYFARHGLPALRFELIVGIISAAFGLFILLQPQRIVDFLYIVLGLIIIFDSLVSLKRAITLRSLEMKKWWIPLLLSILTLALGLLVIFNPGLFANLTLIVIGIILIYEALSDLWCIHLVSKFNKKVKEVVEETVEAAEAIATDGTVTDNATNATESVTPDSAPASSENSGDDKNI